MATLRSRKSKLEWMLYYKWFPVLKDNTRFTDAEIEEYKNNLKLLKR